MTATAISPACDGGSAHQLCRGVSQIAAKATLCSAMPHFDSGPYFAPASSPFACDLLILSPQDEGEAEDEPRDHDKG